MARSISRSSDGIWSAFHGLFFRKFFWDFVGGTIRDPGGLQCVSSSLAYRVLSVYRPTPGAAVFITLIVKAPIIQILTMPVAIMIILLEYPLPQLKAMAIHRSFVLRIVLLFFQAFLTILFYQVKHLISSVQTALIISQGTNSAIWSLIAIFCYTRATLLGEVMEEAKANRGKGGQA